ncbi:hypothetical protein EDB86DRAFT_2831322 [Lactarius hatsudake]|nr:hypothetical protein EDB86DRAFT_2831322 [Lactarius hatsudake]
MPPLLLSLTSLTPVDEPPPHPPHSPRRLYSPKIVPTPPPVVEDDKAPEGGVKTSPSTSVFDLVKPIDEPPRLTPPRTPQKLVLPTPAIDKLTPQTPPPRTPRNLQCAYLPLFIANAVKRVGMSIRKISVFLNST